jgi:hypothetical protein
MNLITIILLLLPITVAILVLIYLIKRSQLWLEAFAAIISIMLASYGVFFGLGTGEIWLLNLILVLSVVQFFGILLFPITSPIYYQRFTIGRSILFDGQSSVSTAARHIQNSRFLSSCIVFFFFLISLSAAFYVIGFIKSAAIWIVLLPVMMAVGKAITWKPGKSL